MPKAAKSNTRTGSSRTDPLSSKAANANKKAPPSKSAPTKQADSNEEPAATPKANNNMAETTGTGVHAPTSDKDQERNYLVQVAMVMSSDPTITRTLSLPPSLTFAKFHEVIQIAFGWANCHMHTFTVSYSSQPEGWPRPVLILQKIYDDDDMGIEPKPQKEENWTLADVFEKTEWDGKAGRMGDGTVSLQYEYDMGDGWEHQILLFGRAQPGLHREFGLKEDGRKRVLCLDGQGHPCAEDCGSTGGWENLKKEFKKQKGDRYLKDWYKNTCANGDPKGLDPYKWSILDVNDGLLDVVV